MKRKILLITALCLLLSGCSGWMDGSHISETPHQEQSFAVQSGTVSAATYMQLRAVLEDFVESGMESGVINVAEYDQSLMEKGVANAVRYILELYPLGVYAIEDLSYEIGSSGGQPAVSVDISYIHGRSEIRGIREVADMEEAETVILEKLESFSENVVLFVENYEESDLHQMVEDYAAWNPQTIMETPQLAVGVYPETGKSRIVELKFTYQTSRDSLRQMKAQVQRVFTSAVYYISSDSSDAQKYSQLYSFLMERFDYTLETSITPSYSLLCYGVGDGKAFASVYAAMCRQAGLECQIISGTRNGDPWYWNLIRDGEDYYHVDLLRSREVQSLQKMTEDEMQGYVWDFSAYPGT